MDLSFFCLLTEYKIKHSDCWKYLKKEKNTPIENTVLQLAQAVSLTTAELVTCIDRGSIPVQDDEVMEKLYDGTDDSYETLAEETQLCHTQYPLLQAVGNLYLNKQISFQSF